MFNDLKCRLLDMFCEQNGINISTSWFSHSRVSGNLPAFIGYVPRTNMDSHLRGNDN